MLIAGIRTARLPGGCKLVDKLFINLTLAVNFRQRGILTFCPRKKFLPWNESVFFFFLSQKSHGTGCFLRKELIKKGQVTWWRKFSKKAVVSYKSPSAYLWSEMNMTFMLLTLLNLPSTKCLITHTLSHYPPKCRAEGWEGGQHLSSICNKYLIDNGWLQPCNFSLILT